MEIDNRIIGEYEGKSSGPLLVVIGGLHGNEPAGILAIREVLERLAAEELKKPGFAFYGKMVGIVGNLQATRLGERFVQTDLNRMFWQHIIDETRQSDPQSRSAEQRELLEIVDTVEQLKANYPTNKVVFLDVHTTSAEGGIFAIPSDQYESVRMAAELHAPVVRGMLTGLGGTLLGYFEQQSTNFCEHQVVAFEAGSHLDPLSVNRGVAAIINCLRSIRCVAPHEIENQHDDLLRTYSKGLPRITRLKHVHHIPEAARFEMRPGYINFMPIRKKEHLADQDGVPIHAPVGGFILMPLYQQRGSDGFFIIQDDPVYF